MTGFERSAKEVNRLPANRLFVRSAAVFAYSVQLICELSCG